MKSRSRTYDWASIAAFYAAGDRAVECKRCFAISNGAWDAAVKRGAIALRPPEHGGPRGQTREQVARLHAQGVTQAAIADCLAISRPTVCFHLRNLGVPAGAGPARRCDWAEIRGFYEAGNSAAACRRRYEFSYTAWAEAISRGAIVPRPRLAPLEEVLAAGRRRCRQHVKARLRRAGLKLEQCEECGLREWRGHAVSLELHHVNGDGLDNRLENLRLLCPNCHSQTETWGARNKALRATAHENRRAF